MARPPLVEFKIADLFCGAGGTSAGAVEALEHLGFKVELTAVNHWPVAIDTHEQNHPGARHLCTGIDSVNPLDYFQRGELDMLWASPECTHHSIARGGKPINDQSRSTAWHVLNWAEKLEPNYVLLENVPEWVTWGPLDENNRPIPSLKGKIFRAMISGYRALGYKLVHGLHCAADYGDPTTRTRLFVIMVKGKSKLTGKKLRVVLPNPTHSQTPDMFASRRWTPAKDIIDWDIEGQSIFARKRPLSEKTMKRIEAGLRKFGLKGFIIPQFGEREGQEPRTHDLEAPAPTVTSHGAGALVQPFIIPQPSNPTPKSVDEPLCTVLAEGSGPKLVQPFILPQHASNGPRSIDVPAPTVTTTSRGVGLVEPYIVAWDHQSGTGVWSADAPLSTVTTKARHGVAEPFLVTVANGGEDQYRCRSISDPVPTVTAGAVRFAIAEPFLVELRGSSPSHLGGTSHSLSEPLGTVTANGTHHALAVPFLVQIAHGASGSEESRTRSLNSPLPTVCGNRGDLALIEPHLLPQQSAGALRPISQPCPTVSTAGAIGFVQPFLISYYGSSLAQSVEEPLDTVTCKDRHALALPIVEVDGQRFRLDIRFRMLQPHELALAQGFPRGYKFTGTKTDQVKQIGNAVPRRLARALVGAVVSQNPDVTGLVEREEQAVA